MKLIIDMPEEDYKYIKELLYYINGQRGGKRLFDTCVNSIANGIPLPKGHGRLIDADTLPLNEVSEEKYNWECGETIHHTLDVVYWDDILNAPTIIEADKGE